MTTNKNKGDIVKIHAFKINLTLVKCCTFKSLCRGDEWNLWKLITYFCLLCFCKCYYDVKAIK